MGTGSLKYYSLGVFLSLISVANGFTLARNETGLYPVYNFSPEDYKAVTQNWCALQDQRGIMYFGNNHRVLEYDGENWNRIVVGAGSNALSMDINDKGQIFVGSDNEFGYLEVDSTGTIMYRSLSDLLPEEDRDFNNVWGTHASGKAVIFRTFKDLFIWEGDSLHAITGEEEIRESFMVDGKLFIRRIESGLARLEGYELVPVKGVEFFKDASIYGMIPVNEDDILIVTSRPGFYTLRLPKNPQDEAQLIRITTPYDSFLEIAEIDNALRISDELISLGTYGNGALIIDTSFNLVTVLNKETGIMDNVVQGQYTDNAGNLWLMLGNGISRVEIQSPLTRFTDLQGLSGTIQSISRFNNTIYVTTNQGLFYMDHDYSSSGIRDYTRPVFRVVEKTDVECWNLLTYRNGKEEILLLVTNDGLYEVSKENKLIELLEDAVYDLYQSSMNPSRVYIGLESGLAGMYRKNGSWVQEGTIDGIHELINSITEDHQGNLWLGTEEEGVLKMFIRYIEDNQIGETILTRYNEESGLPGGHAVVSQLKGPLLVGTNQGLYKYLLREDRFIPDSSFGIPFVNGSHYIHRMIEFKNPEYWMVTYAEAAKHQFRTGFFTENSNGTYDWISEPFVSLSKGLIHAIYLDNDNIVWLGGDKGLYRYELNNTKNYAHSFPSFIRNIITNEDLRLFGGAYMNEQSTASLVQPDQLKPMLPYRNNELEFHFAALDGEDESFMEYSSFLEGNDKDWSDWSELTFRTYTNLHENKYTFHVKARNIYGLESSVATYEFTILAPWFRKWWAYALYVILAGFIVYTIVVIYTRQLREIIRERTAEVVAQKEVIEEKNQDIMASIQYAEKIQRAMLPPEDDLSMLGLDGFILFLPRDVVSGDFYWLSKRDGKTITVAADCTGHGVPGAFMSMLGVAFLNKIVEERHILKASHILNELRSEVIGALKQKGQEGEQKDGMDLALHVIDHKNMKLEFAGANNPLIMIRNNEIIQLKGDRMPIGIHENAGQPFENHEMDLQIGDCLYTFSDGYQDQFGGPENKKFMIKRMKELILYIHQEPMAEQKEILWKAFRDWIEPYHTEQIDDVIVIGVRI